MSGVDLKKKGLWLEFEMPLVEMEDQIHALQESAQVRGVDVSDEVQRLQDKAQKMGQEIFSKLEPWQRVQLARHPRRPTTNDYIQRITDDFVELHGDRMFRDDPSIRCGFAKIGKYKVMLMGTIKGNAAAIELNNANGM